MYHLNPFECSCGIQVVICSLLRMSLHLLLFIPFFSHSVTGAGIEISTQSILVYPAGAWFNCSISRISKDTPQLDTIKWFKDNNHFYTYSGRGDRISFKTLMDQGITDIDGEASTEGNVFLKRTNLNTSGIFRCEIQMGEDNILSSQSESRGVYLPLGGGYPVLDIEPKVPLYIPHDIQIVIVSVDDYINVTCTSKPSFPAAEIFFKINGHRVPKEELVDVKIGTNVTWDGIRGIPFHNKLFVSFMTARIKLKELHVEDGFTDICCSSFMSLEEHGFIHQQDSDTVRMRVVKHKPKVYVDDKIERYKAWFYGFFVVTIFALIFNHYWASYQQKKSLETDASYATDVVGIDSRLKTLPLNNSEVDLCQLRKSFSAPGDEDTESD